MKYGFDSITSFKYYSRPGEVTDFLEGGGSSNEELVFNPETGKLEVMNKLGARIRPGREVITAMNKRDGGGFFFW